MSSEELMRRSLLALALEVPQSVHQSVSDNVHAYVNELLEEVAQRGLRLAEIAQIIECGFGCNVSGAGTYLHPGCRVHSEDNPPVGINPTDPVFERIYRLAKGTAE